MDERCHSFEYCAASAASQFRAPLLLLPPPPPAFGASLRLYYASMPSHYASCAHAALRMRIIFAADLLPLPFFETPAIFFFAASCIFFDMFSPCRCRRR